MKTICRILTSAMLIAGSAPAPELTANALAVVQNSQVEPSTDEIIRSSDGHIAKVIRRRGWDVPGLDHVSLHSRSKSRHTPRVTTELLHVRKVQFVQHPLGGNSYMLLRWIRRYTAAGRVYAIGVEYVCAGKVEPGDPYFTHRTEAGRFVTAGCVSEVLYVDRDRDGVFETLAIEHKLFLAPDPRST